jgi:hypothetical protein
MRFVPITSENSVPPCIVPLGTHRAQCSLALFRNSIQLLNGTSTPQRRDKKRQISPPALNAFWDSTFRQGQVL